MPETTDITHEEYSRARESEVKAADHAGPKTETLRDEAGVIEPPPVPKEESQETPPPAKEDRQQQQEHPPAKEKATKETLSPFQWVRKERQKLKEREAALDAREAQLAALQAQQQQKGAQARDTSSTQYSAEEVESYAQGWEAEAERLERAGAYEEADARRRLAEKAREAIAAGAYAPGAQQAKEQTISYSPEAIAQGWAEAEAELRQIDPDFGKEGSPLDLGLRKHLADNPVYKEHPRGIVAAYHYVSLELAREARQAAEDRIVELEDQLKKLRGSLSVDGASPNSQLAHRSGARRAEDMSLEELQAKLTRDAWALDSRR